MKIYLRSITAWIIFLQASCSNSQVQKVADGESYLMKMRLYDTAAEKFTKMAYDQDRRIWAYDSSLIAEEYTVYIDKPLNQPERWRTETDKYLFVDFRTKSFYQYSSFTDTARLLDTFLQPDTGRVKGGWGFFEKIMFIDSKDLVSLPDTAISGINYKRIRRNEKSDPQKYYFYFLRCDKKNSIGKVETSMSARIGCPVVRFENWLNAHPMWSLEIEHLSAPLSEEQIKVFKAWKEYARKNPVRK